MTLRKLAKLTGFIFAVIGILGFIPGITTNELLFGTFHVNKVHNIVHLLTGAAAFGMSRKEQKVIRYFFQVLGLAYLAAALMGFSHGDEPVLGMSNNQADSWLHLGFCMAFLYIGFLYRHHRSE